MRRWARGGVLAAVGYLLSPLSWWNDFFISIPLAYAFASLFGLVSKQLFFPAIVFGYWAANVLGLVLLHKGAKKPSAEGEKKGRYTKKELAKDVILIVFSLSLIL